MSSANKYWFNGLPATDSSTTDTRGVKYWLNGLPVLVPLSGAPPDTIAVFTVEHGQGYNRIEVVAL